MPNILQIYIEYYLYGNLSFDNNKKNILKNKTKKKRFVSRFKPASYSIFLFVI